MAWSRASSAARSSQPTTDLVRDRRRPALVHRARPVRHVEELGIESLLAAAEAERRDRPRRGRAVPLRAHRGRQPRPARRPDQPPRRRPGQGRRRAASCSRARRTETTVRLARAGRARHPRGRRLDRTLEGYLALASQASRAARRPSSTAAHRLTAQQRERLSAALQAIYGKPIVLQVVRRPAGLGGIRVQVGDEVVDGTVLRRLDEARRHIAG